MTSNPIGKLALVWRGDLETRRQATPADNRWHQIFAALAALNINAEPAVYCEEAVNEVRDQLLKMDGVLVWVDPLSDGRTRVQLDALLREIASRGIWVSTHPDVTQKMGVKEVLYTTRHLGWGTDTRLYRTFDALREEFRGASRPTGHASSSKTAAMAARGYGRSSKRPSKRAMPSCWKHGGAVSRGLYPSLNSS
jgi:hypothetical protein